MLALSRKVHEAIIIGDSIKIEILEIRGDSVRIGISAPISIVVDREEVAVARRRSEIAGHEVTPAEAKKLLRARDRGEARGPAKPGDANRETSKDRAREHDREYRGREPKGGPTP